MKKTVPGTRNWYVEKATMDPSRAAWSEQFPAANSLAELKAAMGVAAERLGFRHYLYRGRFPWRGRGRAEICVDGFPSEFRAYYAEHGYDGRNDPIRGHALNRVTPVLWHVVLQKCPELSRNAREFGLVTGITCPLHAPRGEWGALSLGTARGGPVAERHCCAAMAECQLLACFVHDAATRILQNEQRASNATLASGRLPRMTCRESACMHETTAGKSLGEIGNTLGIAERTVRFHLLNARQKLGATNLRQAISKAIALGLVVPE